ncbi:hypothetical protein VNO77_21006 [Canavalia gladiata]|uniref:Exostosin GT47 domain-containing protein n=1 Tax=Canavalia gladiata TaxID=3824 RepID=A0AAN9LQK4_CANGL
MLSKVMLPPDIALISSRQVAGFGHQVLQKQVIIADDIVLPFADAIPWKEICIFVYEKDVPQLDTIFMYPTRSYLMETYSMLYDK